MKRLIKEVSGKYYYDASNKGKYFGNLPVKFFKIIGIILLVCFLIIIVTAVFSNCKKESGNVKLLERIIEEDGTTLVAFEYDKQNRLVKISDMMRYYQPYTDTITYGGNTITVGTEWADGTTSDPRSYVLNGKTITYSIVDPSGPSYSYSTKMTVNNDTCIITEETQWQDGFSLMVNYEYQGGKLVSITPSNDDRTWYGGHPYQKFIYDDNKSPFYNDKTPKWLLQKLFMAGYSTPNSGLNNNITNLDDYTNYEYEFDPDGFPTKEISSFPYWGDNDYPTTIYSTKRYIYRGEAYALQTQTQTTENGTAQTQAGDFIIEGTKLTQYIGYGGNVVIPSSITAIGDNAFLFLISMNNSPTSVSIPSSVTTIGTGAFKNCGDLESVTFSSPSSVKVIGSYAFTGCYSLTSINIPSSVTSIGECAFEETSLTSVTLPEGLTSIEEGTFASCLSLTSVDIPSSVTWIGDGAFFRCRSLTNIDIPSSVTMIGDNAFAYCHDLTSVTLSLSARVGNGAFGSDVQIHYKDFYIERATSGLLNRFGSPYEYTDAENSGERFVIWTETPLKDFSFVAVYYDPEEDYWAVLNLLFKINEFLPGRGFILNTYIGEGIPTRGISFIDENNRTRFFAIREDGINNGVYHLTEIPITAAG